jgi:acyl carrier protein
MKSVLEILQQIRPEVDFRASSSFVEDGVLDSFDMVTLVSDLDKQFSISIEGTDIVPENFKSLQSIETLLRKYGVNP